MKGEGDKKCFEETYVCKSSHSVWTLEMLKAIPASLGLVESAEASSRTG